MSIDKKKFNKVDLKVSTKTEGLTLNCRGPVVIQPIVENPMGSPKYTVQVSNDEDSERGQFVDLDSTTTDISITDAVVIDYEFFPWKMIRLCTTSNPGDSGFVTFVLSWPNDNCKS